MRRLLGNLKFQWLGLEILPEKLLWLQRRQTWKGDVKGNKIRFIALIIFTINELANFHIFKIIEPRLHFLSLFVLLIWFIAAIDFHFMLNRHWIPKWAPYLMPTIDLILLTWLLYFLDGPKSPLISIHFLIIALAAIRFNAVVVLYTSIFSCLSYGCIAFLTHYWNPLNAVPGYHSIIVILSLFLMGIIEAHLVGRAYLLIRSDKN